MAFEERTITIRDYGHIAPNDMRDAFIVELKEVQKQIDVLISKLAGGDAGESDRIERVYRRLIYQSAINNGFYDDELKRVSSDELSALNDKKPTLAEARFC